MFLAVTCVDVFKLSPSCTKTDLDHEHIATFRFAATLVHETAARSYPLLGTVDCETSVTLDSL